jgi:hypothetical protein
MNHRMEIDTIIAQITPWPMEERMALVHQILSEMRQQARPPAPRRTLDRALGIASGASAPPDDALVKQWITEHRLEKHG